MHSGLDFDTTRDVFRALQGYGDAERYHLADDWFAKQTAFPLPNVTETSEIAPRSN
jgi:hypothetical protein